MPIPLKTACTGGLDRRPVPGREWAIVRLLTARLVRLRVSPNSISVSSLVFALMAAGVLALTSHIEVELFNRALWLSAIIFIVLRLLANLLDGMVAVATNQMSPAGEIYNEFPDRVSDIVILAGFGFAASSSLSLGLIAACLTVLPPYVRLLGKSVTGRQHFIGPMAKQQRMLAICIAAGWMTLMPDAWQAWTLGDTLMITVPDIAVVIIIAGTIITIIRRLLAIRTDLTDVSAGVYG